MFKILSSELSIKMGTHIHTFDNGDYYHVIEYQIQAVCLCFSIVIIKQ